MRSIICVPRRSPCLKNRTRRNGVRQAGRAGRCGRQRFRLHLRCAAAGLPVHHAADPQAAHGADRKRDHAHEEAEAVFGADIRRYETQIERLVCGDDGSVNAVILQGSGEQLPCDLLLLASGFSGCEPASVDAYEAVRKTGVPALTAGDMASGASLVVLAAASGKQAAAQADASLMGYTNIL